MRATTAKYIRLSSEDDDLGKGGKTESNSVTNQRDLLDAFISRTPGLADTNVIEFCDDGWSGKNFERPAVQEMIEQVRQGKIQCIVVKDISRFGRDYITVGNYISCVFPFLGVRFIAVNDGFDSIHTADVDSLETSFKTILYDLYSRDLSRKVRNARRFRAQKGYFISPFAPYGYIKDPADRHHLLIDPDAAEIVRRIFHWTIDGKKPEQIIRALNREGVPTPMLYKRAAGCSRSRWNSIWEDNFWNNSTITMILRDERYVGKNIYGKHMRDMVGCAHVVKVDREDWVTVENTHEGIITQKEFDLAQAQMRAYVEHNRSSERSGLLQGKVRCGICGYTMHYTKVKQSYFYCRTSRVNDAYTCSGRTLENDVLEVVKRELHVRALMAVDLCLLWEEQHQARERDTAAMIKNLSKLREAHQQLSRQLNDLYESFVMGEISKPDYLAIKSASVKQYEATAKHIAELETALDNTGADGDLQNAFVSTFEKYVGVEEITGEIVSEVLSEVRVYPDKRLEIVWNFRDELEKLMLDLEGNYQDGE